MLLPGVVVSLSRPVKTQAEPLVQSWHYPDGLKGYLDNLISEAQEAVPIFASENYISDGHESDFSVGEGAAFALTWLEEGSAANESYVNLIPTPLGGTHEAGLKQAVFNVVNNFITHHNLLPRGVKVQSDDVFSKVAFVLSARVLDPQFQGQTKEKAHQPRCFEARGRCVGRPARIVAQPKISKPAKKSPSWPLSRRRRACVR